HLFAQLEHALAHDADAGAPERVLDDLVVRAGLAAVAELQHLAEEALREDPALELAPLGRPVLEGRIAGVGHVHAGRCEISVEGHVDTKNPLSHCSGPCAVWSGGETTPAPAGHRSMSEDFEPLVEAARGGDEHAFRALIEPLGRELHAYAYRMLG